MQINSFGKIVEVGLRDERDQSHYRQNLFEGNASRRGIFNDKVNVAPMVKFARLVGGLHVVANFIVRATGAEHSVDENFIVNHKENRHEVLIDKFLQLFNAGA